ncbi:MAG: peroxidase-related enzyme [Gammaproteobacteria bacterium]|nr:peroxidase-related enzyme [Gammaproteobacteria bacterium]
MTWIETISYNDATGKLKKLYDRIKGPNNNVDNIMLAHSLRPHTMEGHMALYKHVLHNSRNRLDKSYLETIGVYVSILNSCDYCAEHHFAGLSRLLKDDSRAATIRSSLERGNPASAFGGKELAGLLYAGKLTTAPASLSRDDIRMLRDSGFSDGEILELNQVAAYFAYANRAVLGLGVDTQGDIIGLSPGDSDDSENWRHS